MLSVAGIGAGYFAQFHYRAWASLAGVQPLAAMDQDLTKAEATGLPAFTDAEKMLDACAPDIVDIITPPPTHAAMVHLALERAPKAIICQKPFCQSLEEATATANAAKAAGVPLVIHENFRFQPWYRAMKSALEAGAVGDVHQMSFRLRPGDGQGPDAYLERQPYFQSMERFLIRETAVHWVDTFRYLMGPTEAVFADLRRMNPAIAGEDAGTVLFYHTGGRRSLFDGNRHLDHAAENLRWTMGEALVEGTGGAMTLTGDGRVMLRPFGETARELLAPVPAEGFGGNCVAALQAHVVAALEGRGRFENLAHEYLEVARTEAAIYRSAELGQVVSLKTP